MATTSPLCHEVKEKIELSETEKKIFDRLLGTLHHFGLQTQLRVAGGWVRDKVCKLSMVVSLCFEMLCKERIFTRLN